MGLKKKSNIENKLKYCNPKIEKLFPDFIIGGAMKSGTTTLHQILNRHPDVSMADGEIGFFDLDNILEHPDFSFFNETKSEWVYQKFDNSERLLKWYASKFKRNASGKILIGEDSTTYLSSPIVAKRLSELNKKVKLIFILRHPTERAISNYFHLLKSGRAEHNLEDTLQYHPHSILRRSLYKSQLEHYYKYLPNERIKLVIFEDLKSDTEKVISELSEFLEIDNAKFKKEDFRVHSNQTAYPKYLKLQLYYNRWNRDLGKKRYSSFLSNESKVENSNLSFRQKLLKKIHKKINPKSSNFKPVVNASTKEYLDDFFKNELKGIDEVVGQKVYTRWFNEK